MGWLLSEVDFDELRDTPDTSGLSEGEEAAMVRVWGRRAEGWMRRGEARAVGERLERVLSRLCGS